MRLFGNLLTPVLELPHRVTDCGKHDEANDGRDVEELALDAVDQASVLAFRLENILRGVLCAAR